MTADMVGTNENTPKRSVAKRDIKSAKELLAVLQRGWEKNEWPRAILQLDGVEPDVAIVVMYTEAVRSSGRPEKKLVVPNGVRFRSS